MISRALPLEGINKSPSLYIENFISDFINTLADEPETDKQHR
jgi:hypothetical protein